MQVKRKTSLQGPPVCMMPPMPQQPYSWLQPGLPIFLAPATSGIPVQSSKKSGPDEQTKALAVQFLNADNETQSQMLKDPNVARAILQTLGDSAGPGAAAAAGSAPPGPAAVQAPPGITPPPPPGAPPAPPAVNWSGKMSLTRSGGKRLNVSAQLHHGKVQLVELALRIAAGTDGVLNISHRVPFEDLAKRTAGAVIAFVPDPFNPMYNDYVRYFGAKARAGVATLDGDYSLYLVPPVTEAALLIRSLEENGAPAPVPRNCLLGIITSKPTASGVLP